MEDVVLHYKPGPDQDQDLPALIETTEKLLRPFTCRPPQVFSPWFPSIVDRHLPLRPARNPPTILSAPDQDHRGPTETRDQDQDWTGLRVSPEQSGGSGIRDRTRRKQGLKESEKDQELRPVFSEQQKNSQWSRDRGESFVPETPPDPADQGPGLQSLKPGLQIQEPGLQGHQSGLQGHKPGPQAQEPGLKSHKPGLKSHKPGLKSHILDRNHQEPGLEAQDLGVRNLKPRLKGHKPGLQGLNQGGKVQELDVRNQELDGKGQESGSQIQERGLQGLKPGLKSLNPDIKVQEQGLKSHKPGPQVQEPYPVLHEPSPQLQERGLQGQKPQAQVLGSGPQVQELGGKVQDPGLQDEQPAPQIQEPGPQIQEPAPQIQEPAPQICFKPESPSKRCWTVFMHRVQSRDRTKAQSPVQAWSRRFQQTVSKHRLQDRQRVKWIIDKDNCRDMEQMWRCLSHPPPSLSLPSCCNAHIDRSLDQVWVYCDLVWSEQVGLSLKRGLKLRGRISLWERRLGHFYSL